MKWKNKERKVAKFFNTERTPLSGMNSKITASDTLHPNIFIEHKHRKKSSLWTLFLKTRELAKKEGKIPILTSTQDNSHGFLITIHSSDLDKFIETYLELKKENEE